MMYHLTHYPIKLYSSNCFYCCRRCHLLALQSRSWILLLRGNNQVEGGRVFRIDSGEKEGRNRNKLSIFWKGYCTCQCLCLCLIVICLFISVCFRHLKQEISKKIGNCRHRQELRAEPNKGTDRAPGKVHCIFSFFNNSESLSL